MKHSLFFIFWNTNLRSYPKTKNDVIKLKKKQRWSKFCYGSEAGNNMEKVIMKNQIGQPASLSGRKPVKVLLIHLVPNGINYY